MMHGNGNQITSNIFWTSYQNPYVWKWNIEILNAIDPWWSWGSSSKKAIWTVRWHVRKKRIVHPVVEVGARNWNSNRWLSDVTCKHANVCTPVSSGRICQFRCIQRLYSWADIGWGTFTYTAPVRLWQMGLIRGLLKVLRNLTWSIFCIRVKMRIQLDEPPWERQGCWSHIYLLHSRLWYPSTHWLWETVVSCPERFCASLWLPCCAGPHVPSLAEIFDWPWLSHSNLILFFCRCRATGTLVYKLSNQTLWFFPWIGLVILAITS